MRSRVALAATIVSILAGVAHVRALAFLCDDAFIAFRYADHLASGMGLVFNPGERVEGYTSFLWVFVLAAARKLGARPEVAAPLLGAAIAVATLAIVLRRLHGIGRPALGFGFLVAGCSAWAAWATGGLETSLFTACVTLAFFATLEETGPRGRRQRLATSSVLVLFGALTRPDGLLVGASIGLFLSLRALRRRLSPTELVAWSAGWAVPLGAYLVARHAYYGRWWPNTFAVKQGGLEMLPAGLAYLGDAALRLPLVLVPLPFLGLLFASRRELALERNALAACIAVPYLAFVAWAGGDFMDQFRLVAPLVPMLFWTASESLGALARRLNARMLPALFTLVWVAWSVAGSRRSVEVWHHEVNSLGLLRKYVDEWSAVGSRLRTLAAPSDTVAVTAAGCIPYHSGLHTIDQLGLVAADLSAYTIRDNREPGHRLLIRGDELIRMQPQFIVGGAILAEVPEDAPDALWVDDSGREGLARHYVPRVVSVEVLGKPRYFLMAVRRDVAARLAATGGDASLVPPG